ncbi:type II CRISPR RNA-guided endonuclease Cas9 [Elizabethkingia meningoseptica]|uniref:type II CRISPR RNA-guided endonuclease Cas9 n=1 Tax=Elizabethkingia meningoseptica TaxID=238 RepID=UPI000841D19F|nr:type II CRISPR RNA-guided endonuclease Cas9 [Elizabethkingia meningoseptica]ODM53939.1 type II CRISPR RNA-guided endonuclease Cas9 [Elizabethkingia meningoseptica]OHT29167.1 type II CRISPR RNA-guided endonuclease Cas9 [Elizabethkingia meningoseptica]OPC10348.1 type II CRISPR RNA-guided endonuclease Cas9 [Elizabethkingia meningoseptica]
MKVKNILGLDIGVTSIGFAHVTENEKDNKSHIKQLGVRINPLTVDEQTNFEKGRPASVNADRTLKRGARKMLSRYKDRRKNLIEILSKTGFINSESILAEDGKNTTHSTWALRAKASRERIEKDELGRVLLAINKKRGYKSSRKAKNEDEGQAIDGMAIAKRLYEENLTPGQLVYQLLREGKKYIPDFYRSDLQDELDKVWNFQKQFHQEILTDTFYKDIQGKGQRATSASFYGVYGFNTAENKGSREEKRLQAYAWRSDALTKQLTREEVAFVITEINNNLNNSSGYLGAISDRSKELFFNKKTVGQYLYEQLQQNPHTRLKNQVFYRQDYLDEFETIWTIQSRYYPELTDDLKREIRDVVIFYQRKLKSQKGLVSFCELESKEIMIEKNGKAAVKKIGSKVAPKSSPLFQEFKIWQVLHNVDIKNKKDKTKRPLDDSEKEYLFNELNIKGNLKAAKVIQLLTLNKNETELNYTQLEGNRTQKALYEAYLKILDTEGYDVNNLLGIKSNKDEVFLDDLDVNALEIKTMIKQIFNALNINTGILDFDAELDGKAFEQQASYHLWHLLYSYEEDGSKSGNEHLYKLLENKFGFKPEHARILAGITLSDDYGNLSAKAMRKIYPQIKENNFSTACELVGYRHSKNSLTKEENQERPLKNKLELLKKNSLRQPVVEKILNQMINLVNELIDKNSEKDEQGSIIEYFRFDEIRIELARELKKNTDERRDLDAAIREGNLRNEKIYKLLQAQFGIKNPTRNDIIRYRLYEELKNNGYKDLYTNSYIPQEKLFGKEIDIDHIIPQSKLFDDSFSNKTLTYNTTNKDKGNQTGFDYIESKYGIDGIEAYTARIENLFESGKKNKEEGVSKAKYQKLLKKESEIGDGFIERDLRESQYIAKKAKELLLQITRSVVATSGSITARLREDWDLVNVMKELNLPKYRALGLTEMEERKYGQKVEVIKDWTKRDDHRHHAMDALTIAFTKHNHIQYLNHLNARKDEQHKEHKIINAIENKETILITDKSGNRKRVFKAPMPNFRQTAKQYLEEVLISHKAKNKVVTKNKNKILGKEKIQETLTPRGQLHDQTIYGFNWWSRITLSKKVSRNEIEKIIDNNTKFFLQEFIQLKGSIAKAFSDAELNKLMYKGKILKEIEVAIPCYTQRIDISKVFTDSQKSNSAKEKNIKNILDLKVRNILQNRLSEFKGDFKKAFSDLDKNPIWFNKEKGISIKRVIISGVKNVEPLHYKKDHLGNDILDGKENRIPVDFISTGNNHHVAIYQDEKGNLQEKVVSLFDAVKLVNADEPVIDKTYNQGLGWQFLFTMKQNEMFVFPNDNTGFDPKEIDLLDPSNKKLISPNLFRVQSISIVQYGNNIVRDFKFRNHLESVLNDDKVLHGITFQQIKSLGPLLNIVKVRINHLGDIVSVGEY